MVHHRNKNSKDCEIPILDTDNPEHATWNLNNSNYILPQWIAYFASWIMVFWGFIGIVDTAMNDSSNKKAYCIYGLFVTLGLLVWVIQIASYCFYKCRTKKIRSWYDDDHSTTTTQKGRRNKYLLWICMMILWSSSLFFAALHLLALSSLPFSSAGTRVIKCGCNKFPIVFDQTSYNLCNVSCIVDSRMMSAL